MAGARGHYNRERNYSAKEGAGEGKKRAYKMVKGGGGWGGRRKGRPGTQPLPSRGSYRGIPAAPRRVQDPRSSPAASVSAEAPRGSGDVGRR
ncbi:hypothetical protein E2C01_061521 [Portunus trituberculatus]|uniref:Uncharacterized protein n=1 Tax=Portunus trituberculatus TaxID=210409 RepID=A0A5B7HBH2_PORTR|nr:hypothetical protein [Portunus trituberculatus]